MGTEYRTYQDTFYKYTSIPHPPCDYLRTQQLSTVIIHAFKSVPLEVLVQVLIMETQHVLTETHSAADSPLCPLNPASWLSETGSHDLHSTENIITFATTKLLNAELDKVEELTNNQRLACLSQCIPLEFNSTTYITQANKRKQVEGHMHVCLKIDAIFESMITVSASEPLLSEAAYSIMAHSSFNVPKAMKSVLEGFSINKGDRGEFLLLIIAHDNVVGPLVAHGLPAGSRIINVAFFLSGGLFQCLPALLALHQDFPISKMYLNHYVKVHEYAAIDAESLLLLASQGAGIFCANGQYVIDGINLFLFHGTTLAFKNLSLMLWQGKNDAAFTATPQPSVFEAMDVYKLKIMKEGDVAVPLIKIVFVLATRTGCLTVVRHPPLVDYNAVVYEIWCAGISPDIFNAVKPSQANTWAALLQALYGWKTIYRGDSVDKELRMSMNPGAVTEFGHWRRWTKQSDEQVD